MGIEIHDIKKSYKRGEGLESTILKGVSLTIQKGEMVAIKGKSGAGKSTLLHILGCLDRPTSGSYQLDGVEVQYSKQSEIAKLRNQKFGFILQDFGLINDDTVLDNVLLPMMFTKVKWGNMKKIAYEYLKKFGVEKLSNQEVATLSGGEKQRVAVARALVNDPDYILADEPTGALDSGNTDIMMKELINLNQLGKTVIIVTHDDAVANQCKRIIEIKDGVII